MVRPSVASRIGALGRFRSPMTNNWPRLRPFRTPRNGTSPELSLDDCDAYGRCTACTDRSICLYEDGPHGQPPNLALLQKTTKNDSWSGRSVASTIKATR